MLSSFSTTSSYTQAPGQGKGIYETSKTVPPMDGCSERINCNLIRASTLPALSTSLHVPSAPNLLIGSREGPGCSGQSPAW